MKKLDKLKNKVRVDKKILVFLIVLLIIGIISGSIFFKMLNSSDKTLVNTNLSNFLDKINNNKLDYGLSLKNSFISNISLILIIWLLGISIIGLPIIIVMYFSKTFILGFSVATIISNYSFKGILYSLIYILGQIVYIMFLILLLIYAISFSLKLISAFFNKKTIDFKNIMGKYSLILGLTLLISILTSLYDCYLVPKLLSLVIVKA